MISRVDVHNYVITRSQVFLFLLSAGLILFLPYTSFAPFKGSAISEITLNTFTITNTTSSQRLFEDGDHPSHIGITWNVSISTNSNSTTSLNFTFNATYPTWEGPKSFELAPGTSFNAIYVQHLVTDAVGRWWIDYSLNDSTKSGSGSFSVQLTNPGYDVDRGTGEIYIENITAWLETQSQAKSTTSTSMSSSTTESTTDTTTTTTSTTTPVRLMTIVLGITIIFVRRRKGRI
ncbi:MAG: hypothetical protein ACW97Z_17600 [Candidatus Hodarchaeales archaeon]|jgi:hypothetical protein